MVVGLFFDCIFLMSFPGLFLDRRRRANGCHFLMLLQIDRVL